MQITGRQRTLLGLIIREHVDSTAPVSSNGLREKYALPYSPATIRNEMAALTEQGLVSQPYTSAGRVPTEAGYRYFVQQMMGEVELPLAEQNTISHQFHQAGPEVNQWMRLAASVLSQHSRGAGIVTIPQSPAAYFKHVELIATQGRQVLMVLVLMGGEVRQQMLSLAEPVPQDQLTEAAARMNAAFINKDGDGIRVASTHFGIFDREMSRMIVDSLTPNTSVHTGDIFFDGVRKMLSEPEFAKPAPEQPDKVPPGVRVQQVLEEQTFLKEFLSKVLSPAVGSVQVVIAGEGNWEELRDCSMVLARYGVSNVATGALGILGPTRMSYGRAVSTVRYVAELMTDLMQETYGDS